MMDAASVVVHPEAPAIATLFAPREFTFSVNPVPLLVVVVVRTMQSLAMGTKLRNVLQLPAVPDPEESAQASGALRSCADFALPLCAPAAEHIAARSKSKYRIRFMWSLA
jgi:hypothetical protein